MTAKILAVFLFVVSSVWSQDLLPTLTVDSVSIKKPPPDKQAGSKAMFQTVRVRIKLDNATDLIGLQWTLQFPKMGANVQSLVAGKQLVMYETGPGTINCLLVGMNGDTISPGDVAELTLAVPFESAESFPVEISQTIGVNQARERVSLVGVSGAVSTAGIATQ